MHLTLDIHLVFRVDTYLLVAAKSSKDTVLVEFFTSRFCLPNRGSLSYIGRVMKENHRVFAGTFRKKRTVRNVAGG